MKTLQLTNAETLMPHHGRDIVSNQMVRQTVQPRSRSTWFDRFPITFELLSFRSTSFNFSQLHLISLDHRRDKLFF